MTVLSSAQLTRLRQRPHRTKAYLAIYEPGTVLAAQIDHAGISKGENEVNISIISGAFASIKEGMTVYIGTTPGGRDKGRLRVRSCDASTMTLAENALDWINGWYLTVVKFFEPWAVFPRIVLDSDNVPIFYKDYDIVYDNQNRYMDPVVHMGPHHAGFLISGAHGVYYSASGTFDPTDGSIPTGYQWAFEGGSPSGSMVKDPGYVQYTGTGHYLTELTVVSNSGQSFTGYRHIMVYDRPEDGPNRPIVKFGFRSFEGARDDGGYSVSFFVRERADFTKVREGALVVIFTEQWQGGERVSLGGNAENRSDILFVGYIEDESVTLNAITSNLEFRASSVSRIMGYLSTYSASLESKKSPATWNEMYDMTVDKAVVHFLRWHSTILKIADFSKTGDTKRVQYADFNRGDLYSAVSDFYDGTLLASMVSDRQGKLWAEIDVNMLATGSTRSLATAMTLTRQDWRSEISIQRPTHDELAYIEMGGIAYSGPTTGTFDAYLAGAPGDVAGYFGGVQRQQGLVLTDQTQLNKFVGLAFARANPEYSQVTVPLAGDYRNLDIAPQERLLINLEADENYRGIVWDSKPFVPSVMTFDLRASDQALLMEARLTEETHGSPGTSIEIPVDPPWDTGDLPDWNIEFPPIPTLPPLPVPIEPPPGAGATVFAVFSNIIARTENFWDAYPTWEEVNRPGSLRCFWLHPADPVNTAYCQLTNGYVYKTTNLTALGGCTWTNLFGAAEISSFNLRPGSPYNLHMDAATGQVLAMGARQPGQTGYYYYGVHIRSLDGGASWVKIDGGTNPSFVDPGDHTSQFGYAGPHGAGVLYHWRWYPGQVQLSSSAGGGWVLPLTFDAYLFLHHIQYVSDPGDMIIYYSTTDKAGTPNAFHKSADGGYSSVNISLFYDGLQWYPPHDESLGDHPQTSDTVVVHPRNGVLYALLRNESDTRTAFAVSIGGAWTVRNVWPQFGISSLVYVPLGFNPANENHFFTMRPYNSFGRSAIFGSQDGGVSWSDQTGNLGSLFGGGWGGRIAVMPSWTL